VWQLNDCWPVLSWALVDYHGFGKAAYHFVRRAYAPVLASFRVTPEHGTELWVTNDTAAPVQDTARVRLGRFAGPPVTEEAVDVLVPPNASRCVARWEPDALPGGPDRYLAVSSATGAFPSNRHFFAAFKDLERPPARVESSVTSADDGRLLVTLRADAYAYFVNVATPDERVRHSDNYIELEPGEERTIALAAPGGVLRPEDVTVRSR
jgi:beta-mannosidase